MSSAKPDVDVINVAVREATGDRHAMFRCPGCATIAPNWAGLHSLPVRPFQGSQHSWEWNGDVVKPVFSPSILARWPQTQADGSVKNEVCHSFVGCNGAQPGQIIFLGDSTHALAGKVVDLEPWIKSGVDPFGDAE